MILFFNGAHKNASHFQLLIITEALRQQKIPFEIVGDLVFDETRQFKSGPKEGRKTLDRLNEQPERLHICKAHWGTKAERDLLLSYSQIKVFLIWRDMRDVLVSSYHFHCKKEEGAYTNFEDFYQKKGRTVAFFQMVYRYNWLQVTDSRVFQVNFNALKSDFHSFADKMLTFVGIPSVDLGALKNEMDIARLREKHGDEKGILFRRGVVGEHKEFISSKILEDITWIEGLSRTELYWYHFLHNPKVLFKREYELKGQEQLLWTLRKIGFSKGVGSGN